MSDGISVFNNRFLCFYISESDFVSEGDVLLGGNLSLAGYNGLSPFMDSTATATLSCSSIFMSFLSIWEFSFQ